MLMRLRRTNLEQRKLVLNLGASFATRIPGAVGLLWFLPLLHSGLGTSDYASLLSAIALSGTVAFMPGGLLTVGRRMVGEAYSNNDRKGEADGFMSAVVASLLASCAAMAIIYAYCVTQQTGNVVLIIAMVSAFGVFLSLFENIRAAYNEHYVGSVLLIILQSLGFGMGLLVPVMREDMLLGATVLVGPYVLTSVLSAVLLLQRRPYLVTGRPTAVWFVIRQGTMMAVADGFLIATLSIAVVWVQSTTTDAAISAWFATTIRLFQTFLVPVSLVLVPLSSYIRIHWNGKTLAQQQTYNWVSLSIGLGYAVVVAVSLFFVSRYYISWFLHIPVPNDIAIFVLFAGIVAYRSYSSIAYLVLVSVTSHLALWTTAAVALAVIMAALSSLSLDPLGAIDVYAWIAGASMVAVLIWSALRFSTKGLAHATA